MKPPVQLDAPLALSPETAMVGRQQAVNVDGVIALIQSGKSDKARACARVFRRTFNRLTREHPEMPEQERKLRAVQAAFAAIGAPIIGGPTR